MASIPTGRSLRTHLAQQCLSYEEENDGFYVASFGGSSEDARDIEDANSLEASFGLKLKLHNSAQYSQGEEISQSRLDFELDDIEHNMEAPFFPGIEIPKISIREPKKDFRESSLSPLSPAFCSSKGQITPSSVRSGPLDRKILSLNVQSDNDDDDFSSDIIALPNDASPNPFARGSIGIPMDATAASLFKSGDDNLFRKRPSLVKLQRDLTNLRDMNRSGAFENMEITMKPAVIDENLDFDSSFNLTSPESNVSTGRKMSMKSDFSRRNSERVQLADFFQIGARIGKGNSGDVTKALCLQDFRVYALKCIGVQLKSNRHQMAKELNFFSSIECPYLVSFHGAFFDQVNTTFVLEYMNRGSLQDVIDKYGAVDGMILKRIAKMVLLGLQEMHSKNQIHRDIKPANILLNRTGHCKISDFGIVKELQGPEEAAQSFVGTRIYMSPERIKSEPHSFPADIWSFGLTMQTLACGEFPYKDVQKGFIHLFQTITQDPVPKLSKQKLSGEFQEFLSHCLEKDPSKRWTASELLAHDFLQEVDVSCPQPWPWDQESERDQQDLAEIAVVLGKVLFSKKSYLRSKQNSEIFSKIAESLGIPPQEAIPIIERNIPLKYLGESPFK